MATLAPTDDTGFFRNAAFGMAAVIIAGFSLNLIMGQSSFDSPLLVHAHAIVFMGWVVIFVTQNVLVASGNVALHRRLGWLATGWIAAMVVLGFLVTTAMVRRGQVPFFFLPQQFLVFDPLSVLFFAGLSAAAIANRKRTDWHRRLHYCAMALLLGPGVGRLLPLPLITPWAFEAVFAVECLLPGIGIIADLRRTGRVHPAWAWGIAAMLGSLLLTEAIAYGPAGDALYRGVTAGTPGASVPGLAFPPPPTGPRRTGLG